MKRLLALILAFLFVFGSFVACNGDDPIDEEKQQENNEMNSEKTDDSNNGFDTEATVNVEGETESEKDSETEKETESETESAYDTADGSESETEGESASGTEADSESESEEESDEGDIDAEPVYIREGNKILFGSYPQSEVTNDTLKEALTLKAGTLPTSENAQEWTSYGYYISNEISNYMWYIDVEENGAKYRGVYFTSYRPGATSQASPSTNSEQYGNGYYTNQVYWFEYSDIRWTVLSEDRENGTALIVCESIIDAQEFYPTTDTRTENGKNVYSNNYAQSTVRAWLNDNFYNTAFDEIQKNAILTSKVENGATTTSSSMNSYGCQDTEDKVFLLSYKDMTNGDYGYVKHEGHDTARMKCTSAYAKSQGAWVSDELVRFGAGIWYLRSSSPNLSNNVCCIRYDGYVYDAHVINTGVYGIVPALQIKLSKENADGDINADLDGISGDNSDAYSREGNKITFGSYPQTEVQDEALKTALNAKAGTLPTASDAQNWTSYGYFISGGSNNHFMWYIDVEENGEKYRGVYFDKYRPRDVKLASSDTNGYQDNNGYLKNTVYWFKYEPVSWTVISVDKTNATATILCDMVIDSQAYSPNGVHGMMNGVNIYPNQYDISAIRVWLNETFYNTAFDELQKQIIRTVTVDNSAATTDFAINQSACQNTLDKVFLLSYLDATSADYGMSNASRKKQATDYALSQGVYVDPNAKDDGYALWGLRSPDGYYGSSYVRVVESDGGVEYKGHLSACVGVVPALQIKL